MAATSTLSSPLRAATYQTLIGLLAATGMRVGRGDPARTARISTPAPGC